MSYTEKELKTLRKNFKKLENLEEKDFNSYYNLFDRMGELFFFLDEDLMYSFDKDLRTWGGIGYKDNLTKISSFDDGKRGEFIKNFALIELLVDQVILSKLSAFDDFEKLSMNKFILKKMSLSNHKISFLREYEIFSDNKIYSKIRNIEKLRNEMAHSYRLRHVRYPENSKKDKCSMLKDMNNDWNFVIKNIVKIVKKDQNVIFKLIFRELKINKIKSKKK